VRKSTSKNYRKTKGKAGGSGCLVKMYKLCHKSSPIPLRKDFIPKIGEE